MSSTGDPKNILHNKSRVHLDAKKSALNRTKDQTIRTTRLKTSISKKAPPEDALGTRPKQEPCPPHFLYSGASLNSIANSSKYETTSVKAAVSEADSPLEDKSKQFKKSWVRGDRRQASRSSIRHSDGPCLQAKSNWIPSLRVRRSSTEEPRFSYAQVVSASYAVPQRSTSQTSPAWAVLPSLLSTKSRSSLDAWGLLESATESNEGDSSRPPSVFDGEPDSDEHHSDPETDMSSLSTSEYALPPDLERDDRLINPQQYFADLEDLEANVAGNSGLFLLSRNNRQLYPKGSEYRLKFSFGSCTAGSASTTNRSYDDQILSYCKPRNGHGPVARSKGYEMTSADLSYWAFHILECRNLMLAIVANLERMKLQRYCGEFISILVLDDRRADVVKLQRVDLDTINAIHESLN